MSPEQARADRVDARTDLFSLGCILYELCAGQRPFQAGSITALLMKVATADPVPPQELNPNVPPEMAELIMKLLAKKAEDRPQSAKAVVEALQALEKAKKQPPPLPPPPPTSGGKGSRHTPCAVAGSPVEPKKTTDSFAEKMTKAGETPAPQATRAEADTPRLTATRRGARSSRRLLKPALLALLFLATASLFTWAALRFFADEGKLIVETDDPDTQIIVNQGGKFVAAIDPKDKREIVLKSGTYQIALADEKKGLRLSAREIDLKRGAREVVKVNLERAAVKKPEPSPDPKPETRNPKPDPLPPVTKVDPQPVPPPVAGTGKYFTNSIGMKFVLIPKGKFLMGSPASEKGRCDDEGPQHEVEITQPFHVVVYEVTQEEYEQVTGTNPSKFKGKRNPVEQVAYNDVVEFCKKLSALPEEKRAGRAYRLLTEAEWEYACRGGSTKAYCFGDDAGQVGEYAWYDKNSDGKTHPVGTRKANAFGLHDVHGNVYEWCADWYDGGYYKVFRGGGWYTDGGHCRSALRYRNSPDFRVNSLGFRVAAVQSR